ncbi:hypothetical protein OGATHE_001307 [Ogataea polymorpha]|uniref:Uncharacterized protein n=1 Tax=Ogataea polymorpha TaxID=460523 RepID=A0A9P8PR71_9ASCO|nr:hypothetical protein OGATHE_001307 [Ogataea polymorpha]
MNPGELKSQLGSDDTGSSTTSSPGCTQILAFNGSARILRRGSWQKQPTLVLLCSYRDTSGFTLYLKTEPARTRPNSGKLDAMNDARDRPQVASELEVVNARAVKPKMRGVVRNKVGHLQVRAVVGHQQNLVDLHEIDHGHLHRRQNAALRAHVVHNQPQILQSRHERVAARDALADVHKSFQVVVLHGAHMVVYFAVAVLRAHRQLVPVHRRDLPVHVARRIQRNGHPRQVAEFLGPPAFDAELRVCETADDVEGVHDETPAHLVVDKNRRHVLEHLEKQNHAVHPHSAQNPVVGHQRLAGPRRRGRKRVQQEVVVVVQKLDDVLVSWRLAARMCSSSVMARCGCSCNATGGCDSTVSVLGLRFCKAFSGNDSGEFECALLSFVAGTSFSSLEFSTLTSGSISLPIALLLGDPGTSTVTTVGVGVLVPFARDWGFVVAVEYAPRLVEMPWLRSIANTEIVASQLPLLMMVNSSGSSQSPAAQFCTAEVASVVCFMFSAVWSYSTLYARLLEPVNRVCLNVSSLHEALMSEPAAGKLTFSAYDSGSRRSPSPWPLARASSTWIANHIVQAERDARGRRPVEIPHVRVVLLVTPRWRSGWRILEDCCGSEGRGCRSDESASVARVLSSRSHHDNVVTGSFEISVEGSDVGSGPSIVIGEKDVLSGSCNQGCCKDEERSELHL